MSTFDWFEALGTCGLGAVLALVIMVVLSR